MENTLYQGSKDIFLAKVRADFDAIEDQALKSSRALSAYSLVGTDSQAGTIFTRISDMTDDGSRAVWRHVGTTGIKDTGRRSAGSYYPTVEFIRTYETAVYDPDDQDAGMFLVPDEREAKEGKQYKSILNRASKLITEIDRRNVFDPLEVFNTAFTASASLPTRIFSRGNMGLDGNNTALAEPLVSIQHARADGGSTWSNAVQSSGNARAFDADAYWAAREQGASFVDDVGKAYPAFGGRVTLLVPPANGLVRTAKEIDGSEWKVDSTDNNINVQKGMFLSIISSPYLNASQYVSGVANTYQWHLVDDASRDENVGTGFVCLTFVPLQSKTYRVEERDSIAYDIKQEHVYGCVEPRAIISSRGDGASFAL